MGRFGSFPSLDRRSTPILRAVSSVICAIRRCCYGQRGPFTVWFRRSCGEDVLFGSWFGLLKIHGTFGPSSFRMDVLVPVCLSKACRNPGQIPAVEDPSYPCAYTSIWEWQWIECFVSNQQWFESPPFADWNSICIEKTTHGAGPEGSKVEGKCAPLSEAFGEKGVRMPILLEVPGFLPPIHSHPQEGMLFSPLSRIQAWGPLPLSILGRRDLFSPHALPR